MGDRRTPNSLKGLLKFCIEAGDTYDNDVSTEMDKQKMLWLQEAMKNMTVDVVKEMKNHIQIIIEKVNTSSSEDIKQAVQTLQSLVGFVEDLDCSNDFVKIGGLSLVKELISHPEAEVRAGCGELLATLVQNNPFCQERAVAEGVVAQLVHRLNVEEDSLAYRKLLYGLSCLVRAFHLALDAFIECNGFSCLLKAMNVEGDDSLRIKASFMLKCLCDDYDNVKDVLFDMGLLGQLCGLLQSEHAPWQEPLLFILVSLVKRHGDAALIECRRDELRLIEELTRRSNDLIGQEEYEESLEAVKELLTLLEAGKSDADQGCDVGR